MSSFSRLNVQNSENIPNAFSQPITDYVKSVCRVKFNDKKGTGFLVLIHDKIHGLVTTGLGGKNIINPSSSVIIEFDDENEELKNFQLNIEQVFHDINLDVTIFFIPEKDVHRFESDERKFLSAEINQNIYIFQHPGKDGEQQVSGGTLSNKLTYKDATTYNGSSGSPILSDSTKKVIGIHFHSEKNGSYGILFSKIYQIIKDIQFNVNNCSITLAVKIISTVVEVAKNEEQEYTKILGQILDETSVFHKLITRDEFSGVLKYLKDQGILTKSSLYSIQKAPNQLLVLYETLSARAKVGTLQRLVHALRIMGKIEEAANCDRQALTLVKKEKQVLERLKNDLVKEQVAGQTVLTSLRETGYIDEELKNDLLAMPESSRKKRTEKLIEYLSERGAIGTVLEIASGLEKNEEFHALQIMKKTMKDMKYAYN